MSIYLYANGPAGNHGCEALTRSISKLLGNDASLVCASLDVREDQMYGIDKIMPIIPLTNEIKKDWSYIGYWIKQHLHYTDINYYKLIYRHFLSDIDKNSLYCSMGGDNYAYGKIDWLTYLNAAINKQGAKTVLLGCSILDNITEKEMMEDLAIYKLIIAREQITYNALKRAHIPVPMYLAPDPAFILNRVDLSLPPAFLEGNTVGINLSPMVIEYEGTKGMVLQNYIELIQYIINNTDMNIALIPHVIWKHTDDRIPLKLLYDKFVDTGRVCLIEDCNAEELKGFISRCRFMIAARTHASIAAYSQKVPTLVVGYSVKARGIAMDLFGNDKEYVIPTQQMEHKEMLVNSFKWLVRNEKMIRNRYESILDEYINKTSLINELVLNL